MVEMKKMDFKMLEKIISSVEWTKKEAGEVWKERRRAFQVY